jgi:hypothetical protein
MCYSAEEFLINAQAVNHAVLYKLYQLAAYAGVN